MDSHGRKVRCGDLLQKKKLGPSSKFSGLTQQSVEIADPGSLNML
jgi:hypothetical protein